MNKGVKSQTVVSLRAARGRLVDQVDIDELKGKLDEGYCVKKVNIVRSLSGANQLIYILEKEVSI